MKICFINDTFMQGRGVDTVIYELASRLGKKHEVTVMCSEKFCNIEPKNFKIRKIEIEKLFSGSFKDFLFPIKLLKIRREIKKIKCDIINLHHSTIAPALLGIKNVIVTYHGSPPAFGVMKYPRSFVNILGKVSLRWVKKVITISEYLKRELVKFGVPEKKIVVIPNGVSEEFKPTWIDKNYMLFVGRLEKHKRVEQLIKISKEIGFPLKVVGDGPERQKLEKLAKEIEAPVEFLGNVDRKKLIKLYQECSFFVSASKWEGFGLIFLEANACGKPVIGYNVCAIKERIVNGVNGFKVNSFEGFEKACKKLKDNKSMRRKMGKMAYKLSIEFKWSKVIEKYEKVFKMAVS